MGVSILPTYSREHFEHTVRSTPPRIWNDLAAHTLAEKKKKKSQKIRVNYKQNIKLEATRKTISGGARIEDESARQKALKDRVFLRT